MRIFQLKLEYVQQILTKKVEPFSVWYSESYLTCLQKCDNSLHRFHWVSVFCNSKIFLFFSFISLFTWRKCKWKFLQIVKDNADLAIRYNHLAQRMPFSFSKLKLLSFQRQCTSRRSVFCTNQKYAHAFNRIVKCARGKKRWKCIRKQLSSFVHLNELKIHVRCAFVAIAFNLKSYTKNTLGLILI